MKITVLPLLATAALMGCSSQERIGWYNPPAPYTSYAQVPNRSTAIPDEDVELMSEPDPVISPVRSAETAMAEYDARLAAAIALIPEHHNDVSAPPPNFTPSHYVEGYVRRDGRYVAPHYQTNSDSTQKNNWSASGNVNPYTGKRGGNFPAY